MSAAPLAALAAALGVLAAWEGLTAFDASRLGRALATPLLGGREPTPADRRRLGWLAGATLLVAGWLLAGPVLALVAATTGPWTAGTLVRVRERRRRTALEEAVPAVARAAADALAAGHAIPAALAEGCGAVRGPAAEELGAARAALALGDPVEAVLDRVCARAHGRAWEALAAAVLLQREAGGDLARLLRDLAATREAHARAVADARAATAQARFTGIVVATLPAGAALLAELASPGALAGVVREPLAAWLAGAALVLQAAGLVAIRRIARVRA